MNVLHIFFYQNIVKSYQLKILIFSKQDSAGFFDLKEYLLCFTLRQSPLQRKHSRTPRMDERSKASILDQEGEEEDPGLIQRRGNFFYRSASQTCCGINSFG